jgi:hypothetical protein
MSLQDRRDIHSWITPSFTPPPPGAGHQRSSNSHELMSIGCINVSTKACQDHWRPGLRSWTSSTRSWGRLDVGGGRRTDALAAATCPGYDAERVGCWHLIGNHNLQMYGRLPVRVADVARCANVPSCGAGSLGVWIRMLTAVSA